MSQEANQDTQENEKSLPGPSWRVPFRGGVKDYSAFNDFDGLTKFEVIDVWVYYDGPVAFTFECGKGVKRFAAQLYEDRKNNIIYYATGILPEKVGKSHGEEKYLRHKDGYVGWINEQMDGKLLVAWESINFGEVELVWAKEVPFLYV